jgi:hypothetical protein
MRRILSALLLVAFLAGCSSQATPPPPAARYHVSYTHGDGNPNRFTVDTTTGASEMVGRSGHRLPLGPPPGFTPAPAGRYAGAITQNGGVSVLVYDTQTGTSWINAFGRDGWQKMP